MAESNQPLTFAKFKDEMSEKLKKEIEGFLSGKSYSPN